VTDELAIGGGDSSSSSSSSFTHVFRVRRPLRVAAVAAAAAIAALGDHLTLSSVQFFSAPSFRRHQSSPFLTRFLYVENISC